MNYEKASNDELGKVEDDNLQLLVESSSLSREEVMGIVSEIREVERELTLREGA